MKKYTDTHEWIEVDDSIAKVGITNFAQSELGDIVYVELPKVGESVKAGEEVAVLESTKAAADIYSPISGKIVGINESLIDHSEKVNTASETDGWIFKIEVQDPTELERLMDEATYRASIK